eukprot:scaffold13674_cov61-Phaeocystis_antarctica.AAC.8
MERRRSCSAMFTADGMPNALLVKSTNSPPCARAATAARSPRFRSRSNGPAVPAGCSGSAPSGFSSSARGTAGGSEGSCGTSSCASDLVRKRAGGGDSHWSRSKSGPASQYPTAIARQNWNRAARDTMARGGGGVVDAERNYFARVL